MADTKTVRIQGEEFEVSQPYAEGRTITAAEAKALNQVRAENIGNNFRKRIKDSLEGAEGADSLDTIRTDLAAYDGSYEFTLATASGAAKLDPVEREAKKIARNAISAALKKQGTTLKAVEETEEGKQKIADKVAELMERDDVVKAAKKAVAEQQKLKESLTDVSI